MVALPFSELVRAEVTAGKPDDFRRVQAVAADRVVCLLLERLLNLLDLDVNGVRVQAVLTGKLTVGPQGVIGSGQDIVHDTENRLSGDVCRDLR